MNPKDHTAFIVGCITMLCLFCIIGSTILSIKGYDSAGAQMIMAVNSGISGLVGFLARGIFKPETPPDTKIILPNIQETISPEPLKP